jgi:nitrate/TMAO reductase-like tetraheme cytochrome c subunit
VAEDEFLNWYYLNEEKGVYKRCSRCGQIKLAHNKYFSKNKTSKDGFYSICKECRNRKKGKPIFEEDGQNDPISISED